MDFAELFCGAGHLAGVFKGVMPTAECDVALGRGMDITRSSGFGCHPYCVKDHWCGFCCFELECMPIIQVRTFLSAVLMAGNPNAIIWLGVCCCSWVSTSRGSTKRSFARALYVICRYVLSSVLLKRAFPCSKDPEEMTATRVFKMRI